MCVTSDIAVLVVSSKNVLLVQTPWVASGMSLDGIALGEVCVTMSLACATASEAILATFVNTSLLFCNVKVVIAVIAVC